MSCWSRLVKFIALCFFIFVFIPFASGREISTKSFYSIDILNASLDRSSYSAGDALRVSVNLRNVGDTALARGILVFSLVQGCPAPAYPPHSSDCDNVFYETYQNLTLAVGDLKEAITVITLPSDLGSGTYRVDVYLKTQRAMVKGNHESYDPIWSVPFSVSGGGNFPRAKILRSNTHIEGAFSQSGPLVARDSVLEGWVGLNNSGDSEFRGTLVEELCIFGDMSFLGCIPVKEYPVSIPPNKKGGVATSTPTNVSPDAYTVLYKLVDNGARVHSIYKNRIIVEGQKAKVIELTTDRLKYELGDLIVSKVGVTGPFFPERSGVSDVELTLAQYKGERVISSEKFNRSFIDVDEIAFFRHSFSAPDSQGDGKVCASLKVGGVDADFACVAYGAEAASTGGAKEDAGAAGWSGKTPGSQLLLAGALIVVVLAFIIILRKRGNLALLLVFLSVFPAVSNAAPCEAPLTLKYYFDGEEITNLPIYQDGAKFILANTTITSPNTCNYNYHSCGNTAQSPQTYTPLFSVVQNAEVSSWASINYTMTLSQADVANVLSNYIYSSISFEEKATLFPPLASGDVPFLGAITASGDMDALEVAIGNHTFANYSRRVLAQFPDMSVNVSSVSSSLIKINVTNSTNASSSTIFYVSLERAYGNLFDSGKIVVHTQILTDVVPIGPSPRVFAAGVTSYKLTETGMVTVAGSGGTFNVTDSLYVTCGDEGCRAKWR